MKRFLMPLLLLATPLAQAAPGLNIYGGAYSWQATMEGDFNAGNRDVDVRDDLGFDKADQSVFYVGVEHAVPVVPNMRVRYMDLSDTASNRISKSFTFNGKQFVANTRVDSDFDLNMLDGTLYYSPIDNALKLDLGLTVRKVDGTLDLNSVAAKTAKDIDITLPMLYAAVKADLPVPGVYAGAELNAIGYDGNSLNDYNVRLGWRSDFLLGVELGYSHMQLTLDDLNNMDTNLTMGGPYVALALNF
ncbi:hypothetical protein A11A3_00890 [Alcanivorax hongdengensis A-11-3]|uniref:Outer membrane protein n=1 Tax=Alcanivorax hongdengensis A-11-3 TaxID=1177179 RepID=L0WG74_9GAMM|nr:TIGR04219 family outer membrane beta-barrel protein [Alcanivorax hongdengensis]EKF76006.1 hypothetical protein A11A3_00890 [Alcanivorax hongdengensis A-11-3]